MGLAASIKPGISDEDQCIFVDYSHCNRRLTGIERIALEQFSHQNLAPLPLKHVYAKTRMTMLWHQNITLPFLLSQHKKSLALCPGFPPSLLAQTYYRRVIPYIHDVFPLTRSSELKFRARLYTAPLLRKALKRFPIMMVNSQTTSKEIVSFTHEKAEIILFRPEVRDIFNVEGMGIEKRSFDGKELRLLALGTIEPRKNLLCAAALLQILRERHFPNARLDIVGRNGWGDDASKLAHFPGVSLHGYQNTESVRYLLNQAHALINTSHAEGLGLPLLEAQHAGLLIIARDLPIFHETLKESSLLIDCQDLTANADRIAACFRSSQSLSTHRDRSLENVYRWNKLAQSDRETVIARLVSLLKDLKQSEC